MRYVKDSTNISNPILFKELCLNLYDIIPAS